MFMSALAYAVAAEIRAETGRQRVSGRELARRIDEPVTTVSRWLRGDTPVGLDELDKIAAALDVDVVDLIRAARLQMKKLPRQDLNLQPAGWGLALVSGGFHTPTRHANTRWGRFRNRRATTRPADAARAVRTELAPPFSHTPLVDDREAA